MQTVALQMTRPNFPRNIRLDTCAVTLAADFPGAMAHLSEGLKRTLDVSVRRPAVALDVGYYCARAVLLFDTQLFE